MSCSFWNIGQGCVYVYIFEKWKKKNEKIQDGAAGLKRDEI